MEKIFQNLHVRLKFNTRSALKIKLFVAREIQYFELGIFSFDSHVYYLTGGFIASIHAFNLLTRALNLPTRAFRLPTRAFNLATRDFSVLTREFELVTRRFELVTRGFELVTRGFELVTRNSCFTFPQFRGVLRKRCSENIHQIQRRTPMPKGNFNKAAKQCY